MCAQWCGGGACGGWLVEEEEGAAGVKLLRGQQTRKNQAQSGKGDVPLLLLLLSDMVAWQWDLLAVFYHPSYTDAALGPFWLVHTTAVCCGGQVYLSFSKSPTHCRYSILFFH